MDQDTIQGFRLSPQQKHLWLSQQTGHTQSYRVQCSLLIEGILKIETLELALKQVVKRHEILRTTFQLLPEMTIPIQVIEEESTLSIDVKSLEAMDAREQEARVETVFREVGQRPFDFAQGPLLYASLLILSAEEHVLIMSLPAICADTWALKNLVSDLSRSYAACVQQEEEVSNEPMQYADFAEWQNELLESQYAEAGRDYWRTQVDGTTPYVAMPFEKRPSENIDFEVESSEVRISPEVAGRVKEIAEQYGSSPAFVLMSCWATLLWRLFGQPAISIGAICDGRKYNELEQVVGLCSKCLPLHLHLEGNLRFAELLERVIKGMSDAYKWQEYFNYDNIGNSASDTEGTSFRSFCFEFLEEPQKYSTNEVSFSIEKWHSSTERFKIKMFCVPHNDFLRAEFFYDSNLFSKNDIGRLAGYFSTVLESALEELEKPIGSLKILNEFERQRILCDFNDTKKSFPKDKCIHQTFESQVTRTPDAVAVVFEDEQLTYGELNHRADQLARCLKKCGVGPDVVVGILLDRSLETICGMLGVLKAGGAYLPLDPSLPQERIRFMLEDAQAKVLLTRQQLSDEFSGHVAHTVLIDSSWDNIALEEDENEKGAADVSNLVYVIYTSGSTGRPKGVAVEHRQLVNYVNSIVEILDLPAGSSFATVSTFAADLGNTAIFPALCNGGTLHIISEERAVDPEAIADYVQRHSIDLLKIVPSHLKALLSASQPEHVLPLKRLVLGGEGCEWSLVERIRELAPTCVILNHYGPTEATVGTTTYLVGQLPSNGLASGLVPIGRPVSNAQVYVLDGQLQPVPIGAPGELYIGGDGVARGYLNRPELTRERFIPNLLSPEPNARLYRTGDLARYSTDGDIEYLGRVDHQVKIHGFRIELGEIESVLSAHPEIKNSVVVASEDQTGNKRLVAYLVVQGGAPPTIGELRTSLKEKLPDYMIPSGFVFLDKLPLTPNGKLDRQALPKPDRLRSDDDGSFVPPGTAVEERLAGIWAGVLGIERVGIRDNFFELGGDSILSIQIIARANQVGLQLTPKLLFQNQTVAELAAVAGTAPMVRAEQTIVTGPVPLTPIQRRFFDQNQPDPHYYNQAMMLKMREDLDPKLLKQVVEQLLIHHDALRLRFVNEAGRWQQLCAEPDSQLPLTEIDLSVIGEQDQEIKLKQLASELQASLNLTVGPLMRVAHIYLGPRKGSRLLIVIHHLAVDGVSWRILLEDLQTGYEQLKRGQAIKLPAKTTSLKQWAEQLTEYALSETAGQEAAHWLATARGHEVRLPRDYVSEDNTAASAHVVTVSLTSEETRSLLQDVPSVYRTQINDVLLTSLVQAIGEWSGELRLLVDLEGHGREEIIEGVDLSRTVGWCTTIYPVLLKLKKNARPDEALKAIKEQLRAVPRRGIGYGVLRYLKGREEIANQLRMLPAAEIRFNYLGQLDQLLRESSLLEPAKESSGATQSPSGLRNYLINVIGSVTEGRLHMNWAYSANIHQHHTIERLADGFMEALRVMITHCQSSGAGGFTPSDFPKAGLNQKDLDKFIAKLS